MVSLQMGHNEFYGAIPDELYEMQLVTYLDISGNRCVCSSGSFVVVLQGV